MTNDQPVYRHRWQPVAEEESGRGRTLLQALAAARRTVAHETEVDAAVEAFISAEESSGSYEAVVVDLRPERPSVELTPVDTSTTEPVEPAPPGPGGAWVTFAPPPDTELPPPPALPAPAWGSLWKQTAQGWVRDEQGHLIWRPIVTTTAGVANWEIDTSLGLVTGESACPVQPDGLATMVASGEGNAAVRVQLEQERERAAGSLVDAAVTRGAHAVVGVRLEYTFLGECLVVTATGTAVTLRPAGSD